MTEKLQKVLARAGLGSRREMETWIEQGRISVNGKVATLGDRVEVSDTIRADGKVIEKTAEKLVCRMLMYNKPEGEICTRNDPEGRDTVFDRLPKIVNGRWIAIGRLDINTQGLLMFTNDGELANRLMHPSHEITREYAVRTFGEVTAEITRNLKNGVMLEDGPAKFDSVKKLEEKEDSRNQWYAVTLKEGRNREVRRLWESQDIAVSRLIRTQYGNINLDKRLPLGGWKELGLRDINYLRELVQLPAETESKVIDEHKKLDHQQLTKIRRNIRKAKVRKNRQAFQAKKRR